jgi:hypothetical protein
MKFIVFVFAVVLSINAYSQVDVNRFSNIVNSVSSGSAAYGSGFKGSYNVKSAVKGDPYLDTAFRMTNFTLYKTEAKIKTPARYDILNDELEIKTTGGVMILPSKLVDSYAIAKSGDSIRFVNLANYKFENTVLVGFMEILSDGKIQLLKQTKTEIVKPSYNPSLEVGDRDMYIVKKTTLFYSLPDKKIVKVKGKSETMSLFGQEASNIKTFATSNSLSFKNEEDLKKLFAYYNSLGK